MDAPQLAKLLETVLLKAKIRRTPRLAIHLQEDAELRVQEFVPLLQSNQLYHDSILRLGMIQDRIKNWFEDEKSSKDVDKVILSRIVQLLGKSATRNVIVSVGMLRDQATGLQKKRADKFLLSPSEQLKLANQAEAFCEDRELAFTGKAFEAGLHWDTIRSKLIEIKAPKDVLSLIDTESKEALRQAAASYALCSHLKDFKFAPFAFGAGLLAPLGKVLMAMLFPKDLGEGAYSTFLTEIDKYKSHRREALWLLEKKKFPMTHEMLSSLYVSFGDSFRPIEKALYFMREPQILKNVDRDLYRMSMILHLSAWYSDSVAGDFKKRKLTTIQKSGLEALGLSVDEAIDLITPVLSDGKNAK